MFPSVFVLLYLQQNSAPVYLFKSLMNQTPKIHNINRTKSNLNISEVLCFSQCFPRKMHGIVVPKFLKCFLVIALTALKFAVPELLSSH